MKTNCKVVLAQWFAGIGVTMLLLQVGFVFGWTSPALARLTAPDSPIPMDPAQASWVASLVNLGRFFGAILGSFAAHGLGSKSGIFATTFPIAAGWILVGFAESVEWLYLARLSLGIGFGMAFATFPLYLGEVAMPEIRGALISLAGCGGPFGQVLSSAFGAYLPMQLSAAIYLAACLLLMLAFFVLPESPHHLVKLGRVEAARRSIGWYRAGRDVEAELQAVQKLVGSAPTKDQSFGSPAVRRATLQIVVLFALMQMSGLNIVMFFMESILVRAGFACLAPAQIVVYANLCGAAAAATSIFLIERCGRKFLLAISSAGSTLSMLGLSGHFWLMGLAAGGGETAERCSSTDLAQWLPALSVFLFMISFFVGLLPAPNAILGETFPANVKCRAACIAILTAAVVSFFSAKTYHPLLNLVGDAYVFLIYAIFSALILPYTVLAVKETKGKSLHRIQEELIGK